MRRETRAWLVPVLAASLLIGGCATGDLGPLPPDYAPPPARGRPITREEALGVANGARDGEEAIRRLDRYRFDFALDRGTIRWFRDHGLSNEVIDYLEKRGTVDWDGTRGDVDPDGPFPRTGYVDPRRGFEDFGGTMAPDRTPRGHDPWTGPATLGIPWGLSTWEGPDGRRVIYFAPTGERYQLLRPDDQGR
jgi:hypothetical protein